MNIHLQQHKWKHTTHNNHPTIETLTHQNGTTTHIQITQITQILTTQHTNPKSGSYAETITNYTQTHTTISLLDPDFLHKIHQIIKK